MSSVVNDSCVKCSDLCCAEVCPAGAFHEDETMVVINPDVCISCGTCIPECPQSAITTKDDADTKWVKYNAENAAYLPPAMM